MVDERDAVKVGNAIGAPHTGDGIVFVRLLAPGCWALTADHRVFYIHRRQSGRGVRIFDFHDPWSPDKGIA